MITQTDPEAALKAVEEERDTAIRDRDGYGRRCDELNDELHKLRSESHKNFTMAVAYMKERDKSQLLECAMREALANLIEDCPRGSFNVLKARDALYTDAGKGWVKLRWRPGTEVPDPNTNVIVRSADGYWMAGLNRVIRASDFWLYAYELLEKGTQ